jgi:DNA-binding NarL/FixJ family response regulator
MSTNIVVIVGAIAGAKGITLYHKDGRETNLALESWRTKQIMDKVTPFIARREPVEIDLDTYDVHAHIERKSGGLIRFVREKIASVRTWFKPTAGDDASKEVMAFQQTEPVEGHVYGVPAAAPDQETVVAVIGDRKVPGVEALEKHMEHALATGNTEGVENFMKRCAAVIDTRGHSIQELLNFMRKGDLPIAKDGSIIAYKVLQTATIDGKQVIVDCASRKVIQRVGSRVVMDEKLVDPSRRTQCSSGLHIARRGYLGHFGGDVIMMVKIAPEDVIAVPVGEPDKMRVAAYHVVGQIPNNVHALLRSNKPMTGDDAASRLLADVIAGNHVGVLEEVRITGPYGAGLKITPLVEQSPAIKEGISGTAKALDDEQKPAVTAKELREAVRAVAADAPAPEAEITRNHVQMINGELHVDGEKMETETAQERRNRLKRETRAAKKPSPQVQEAAKTGDLSAAITQAVMPKAAPADQSKLTGKPNEKHERALALHKEGKSNRAIEAELHICRKTLKKLFDKHGLKPNG